MMAIYSLNGWSDGEGISGGDYADGGDITAVTINNCMFRELKCQNAHLDSYEFTQGEKKLSRISAIYLPRCQKGHAIGLVQRSRQEWDGQAMHRSLTQC